MFNVYALFCFLVRNCEDPGDVLLLEIFSVGFDSILQGHLVMGVLVISDLIVVAPVCSVPIWVAEHYNECYLVDKCHLPEVLNGFGKRGLGPDKRYSVAVQGTPDQRGVDVLVFTF